ncbi:arylacetamide deacetylase-like 2 isoform X1 [Canis lupus baileyi]|uniref:Arylacetamide deacetylase like 2 n=3 Tax=Canis lupus familiaris TaxID=9615 RepID=A0A8C0SKC7_CANLF|nr:arylacetamide deacetylase-like 2 isoform X1 [Canis lupus familiaris]XP_038427161.1 arylacetamide deacetylase-like 2 isoform X1 [Canis lupus familiaris]
MGFKALCLGLFCALFASHLYISLPDDIEEYWKVVALATIAKTFTFMGMCIERMGIIKYEELVSMLFRLDETQPVSDENVTVMDTEFSGVPVRVYLPKRKSDAPRRAVIYIHGGAFCFGSFKNAGFDSLNRWTANKLDSVVVGVDYRLAPQHHFPVQFEDCLAAVKFFLQDEILAKYGVDPTRICISGDSSGAGLAAGVTQQVQTDTGFKHKIKIQALLYPSLQIIDSYLPSHQENEHGIILPRDLAIKLVSLYLTKDETFVEAMRRNEHMPQESRHLFQFVNWSTLLPEKYRKGYVYTEPILGKHNFSFPGLMDIRISPLLANDSLLQNLPPTYILTCQYDIVRDDGLMYVSRLQNVGVQVTHDHIENGIHAALSFMTPPLYLHVGLRIRDMYISWLDKNL